jgi:hypothetical protein
VTEAILLLAFFGLLSIAALGSILYCVMHYSGRGYFWTMLNDVNIFVTDYSRNSPDEEFADLFYAYLSWGDIFRRLAKENEKLRRKYDLLKTDVFNGIEYTRDKFGGIHIIGAETGKSASSGVNSAHQPRTELAEALASAKADTAALPKHPTSSAANEILPDIGLANSLKHQIVIFARVDSAA